MTSKRPTSEVLLEVADITERLKVLEKWICLTVEGFLEKWSEPCPPMLLTQSGNSSVRSNAYTTAAIYLVRLREAVPVLVDLSAQKHLKGETGLMNEPKLLEKFVADKYQQLCALLSPLRIDEVLSEGLVVGGSYAAGYLAQASLVQDVNNKKLLQALLLYSIDCYGKHDPDGIIKDGLNEKCGVRRLFASGSEHANTFLLYLACVGLDHRLLSNKDKSELVRVVSQRAHYLLAKGHMKDTAEFDPGELAYAAATLHRLRVDKGEWWRQGAEKGFFRECFRLVFDGQAEDGLWNAGRPWVYTAEGGALHMISLERANAALEVLGDPLCVEAGLFEEFKQHFERTHDWLKRTRQKIADVWGWTSEHSFEFGSRIDLWVNAHAVRFCILYREALRRYVEKLVLAQFSDVKKSDSLKPVSNDGFVDPMLNDNGESVLWSQIADGLPKRPAGDNKDAIYSLLLYGPPGTSKTTIARRIASDMKWPFITITSSDFIATGADTIEARASEIFRLLASLPRGVVLFDEIDAFIGDREAEVGSAEFRFMTTSLLPKLQDLRDAERVVFVIATNNPERIDLAIQRSGRIDVKLLVPPPNSRAIRKIVESVLSDTEATKRNEIAGLLAQADAWYTYSELKLLARRIAASTDPVSDAFNKIKDQVAPAASDPVYEQRLMDQKLNASRKKEVEIERAAVKQNVERGP